MRPSARRARDSKPFTSRRWRRSPSMISRRVSAEVYTQRYQWPLAAALVHAARERAAWHSATHSAVKSPGRDAHRMVRGRSSWAAQRYLLLCCSLPVYPAHASTASAKLAYAKGDYVKAERDYAAASQRAPNAPALEFNLGTAAYKAGRFGEAAQAFQASLGASQTANAKRLAEQEDAYYNLGNTMYRSGQKTEQSNAQQTIDNWTPSRESL